MKRTNRMTRPVAFAAALVLAALMGAGCIFDTRSAQAPGGSDVPQIPLDDAIDVFTSMETGLEGDAIANYQRALSDEFIFSPLLDDSLDQTFAGNDPSVYNGWTKDVEIEVTNLLLSEYDSLTVDFGPSVLIDENTFVRYRASYSIRGVPSAGGEAATYKGVAHIDVQREGGVWQVIYWDEVEPVEGFRTWGFLRGILRQRLLS
jgi:hypothetical protein